MDSLNEPDVSERQSNKCAFTSVDRFPNEDGHTPATEWSWEERILDGIGWLEEVEGNNTNQVLSVSKQGTKWIETDGQFHELRTYVPVPKTQPERAGTRQRTKRLFSLVAVQLTTGLVRKKCWH